MSLRLLPFCLSLATLAVMAGPSFAASDTPDDRAGRFTLSPVDGGFLRLDRQTGAMAMCARKSAAWVCDPVEDPASTKSAEMTRLEAENSELKERVRILEEMIETAPNGGVPDPLPPEGSVQLPTEEEVDKALDYVENIFKKFRDRIRKYEEPALPSDPQPDSTPPAPERGGL